MTPIQRFDDWVHKNLMNPTFVWVQKIFHWNRFQLIQWFSIAFGTVLILEIFLLDQWLNIIMGVFIFFYLWSVTPFLSSLSKEFEQAGFFKLPAQFKVWSHLIKSLRPVVTFLTASAILPLAAIGFSLFLFSLVRNIPFPKPGMQEWLFFFHEITLVVIFHLWSIDDISPEDRAYLIGRQTARDIA